MMKHHDYYKEDKLFWIFLGVLVAIFIAIVIFNVAFGFWYIKGVFSADMPEWAKLALLTLFYS